MKIQNTKLIVILSASIAVLAISSFALAQVRVPEKLANHHGHERLLSRLNLSESQRKQIQSIKEESRARLKTIWSDDRQSVGALKSQLKALREETKSKVASVLTTEQKSELGKAKSRFKDQVSKFKNSRTSPST